MPGTHQAYNKCYWMNEQTPNENISPSDNKHAHIVIIDIISEQYNGHSIHS